jgi:hypothetical protein
VTSPTTTGRIQAILGADITELLRKFRQGKTESKAFKSAVERDKPDIDANEKPFVAAVSRAAAAKDALDAKIRKTVADLEVQLSKAGTVEANALGKVRIAQAALNALREKGSAPAERLLAAEERLAAAERALTQAQEAGERVATRLGEQRAKLANVSEQVVEALDSEADGHTKAVAAVVRHGAALKVFTLASAGSTAAMLAGGIAAGAVVAALPVAAIAAAAVLLSSNRAVADSFSDLADDVGADAREMAAPLENELIAAALELRATWGQNRGLLAGIFRDSEPAVRELSRGVNDLVGNSLPGISDAVRDSQPIMAGWRRFLGDTGTGVSEFFRNASRDAESTGRNVAAFGEIVRTVLSFAGRLVSRLSSEFAPHADQFADTIDRTLDVVMRFADGALPVFSTALGVLLDVADAVLDVLEPIAETVGSGIGLVLSGAAAWRAYSAALQLVGKSSITSALTQTALSAAPLPGLLGKIGVGAGGAAAGTGALGAAFSPLGISLAATALLMGTYLLQQQKIDQGADRFVQGILKGGEAAQNAARDYAALQKGLADLVAKRDEWNATDAAQAAGPDDAVGAKMNDQIFAMTQNVDAAKKKWDEYLASVGPVEQAQAKLNLAIAQYGKDSPQATAAGAAYRAEISKQEAASKAAADAVKSHTDSINENLALQLKAAGAGLDYEASLLSLESAQKNLNEAVKTHGKDSLEARTANNQYQQQLLATVDAIGAKVAAENAHLSASELSTKVTQAQYGEILRLAAAAGTNAPAALQKMIGSMDGAALAAMGVTVKVDQAGRAVLTMPDGKKIVITGENAEALRKIAEVNAAEVRSKTLYLNLVTRADTKQAADWLTGGLNDGGWVPGNGPDRDDRLVPLTSKEFVVNRRAAAKHGRLLEAINASEGGDVRMPESALASLPMPRTPATLAATAGGSSSSSSSGSGGSGRAVHIGQINLTEIKTMPSKRWIADTLTDIVEGVMVDND